MFYKLYIYSNQHKKHIYVYDTVYDENTLLTGYISKISPKGEINNRRILKNKEYIEVTYNNHRKVYDMKKIKHLSIV